MNLQVTNRRLIQNDMQIKENLEAIVKAKKPVLLVGVVSAVQKPFRSSMNFAERYQIPVVTSLWGKEPQRAIRSS